MNPDLHKKLVDLSLKIPPGFYINPLIKPEAESKKILETAEKYRELSLSEMIALRKKKNN